jgi:hypothetical protein
MEDQNEAPQQEAPQTEEVVDNQGQPAPQVDDTTQTETPQTETTQEPSQTTESNEQPQQQYSQDYSDLDISPYMAPQQPNIQPDEDGYIDPNKFYQAVMQDVEQKLSFQQHEQKAWSKVEQQYPEIKEDPDLRELVHSARLNDVTRGGKGDLNAAADKVFGKLKTYQSRGKAQAQVSEKVQKSATLQTQTATNTNQNADTDLIDRMSRGDEVASETLISKWLEEGKL